MYLLLLYTPSIKLETCPFLVSSFCLRFFTSYSFFPSMTTSCSGTTFWPSTCSLYSHTLLTLTTRYILIVFGNSSSIAFVKTTLFTLYGPTNYSISFSVLLPFICHFKSFVLSITKFSFWYFSPSLLFLSTYYFISSCVFFSAAFTFF